MKNFGITISYTIDEYYFGKSNEEGIVEDYEYNSTEFIKILIKINNLSPLNSKIKGKQKKCKIRSDIF